jgi:hypothetical protein
MGFLDIFSGKQARQTAMANSALAQQTFGNLNTMLAQNRDQSQQYITNANEAVQNRYNQARADVTGGYNQARTDLSGGYDAARGTLNQATGLMQPYIAAGAGADKLYGGAIGLGGQEGGDLARRSFQEAPGTEYQIRRASEEAARKAGSLGMAASGDTLNAVAGQAQQRANAGWDAWLDRLKGVGDRGYNASTGQANLYGAIANTQQSTANSVANLGTQLLGIQIGQADKAQAAGDAAAANQFGAIMAGLKAAAGIATAPIGGALGGGGAGQSLFSLGTNKIGSAFA